MKIFGYGIVARFDEIKIFGYGIVAGIAWLLDFTLFTALILASISPLVANLVSATTAVTFAFFISSKKIFYYEGDFLFAKFIVWFIYQAISIIFFSYLIDFLVNFLMVHGTVVKIGVTPITFYTNFMFISVLLTGRIRYY